MKTINVNNVVEAKSEYTKQLNAVMCEPIVIKMIFIYQQCKNTPPVEGKTINVLVEMQKKMKEIPGWNAFAVETETKCIMQNCAYLSDLLAAVFVSNVKILTSIRVGKSNKKVQIKMPSNDSFVHHVYIKVAEEVYNNPFIFEKEPVVYKKDLRMLVVEAIDETIRTQLPLQNILQNYIGNGSDTESESENEDTSKEETTNEDEDAPDDDEEMTEDVDNNEMDGEDLFKIPGVEPENEMEPKNQEQTVTEPRTSPQGFFDNSHEVKNITLGNGTPQINSKSPFGELDEEENV